MNTWLWIALVLFAFIAGTIWRRDEKAIGSARNEFLKNMKIHLQNLRDQVPGNSGHAQHIKDAVKDGRISYEFLGTSEAELDNLGHRLECKQGALNLLSSLRNGTHDYEKYIPILSLCLKDGGLSLTDIGSSESEFASFADQNKKILARNHLSRFRSEIRIVINASQWIMEFRKRGVPDSDLGLTIKEHETIQMLAAL